MIKSTKAKLSRSLLLLICFALFFCLGGCGGSKDETGTGTGTDTTTTAASLVLSAKPTTIKSNDLTNTIITITALNASMNSAAGVAITVSADTGVLTGAQGLVTDSSGKATVIFSSGIDSDGPINRTATITATAGAVSAQIPIQIVGSTVKMELSGTTVSDDGSATVIATVTAKDAGGKAIEGADVAFTSTGSGSVTIIPASGQTDSNGQLTATVKGTSAGTVTLIATALGATASKDVTVSAAALTFAIDGQWLNGTPIANTTTTTMTTTQALEIEVNAPSSANVIFATTTGVWDGGSLAVISKSVVGGKATATLTTTQSGVATVQVYDQADETKSDSLKVGITSGDPAAKITFQTSLGVVPKSVGTTTGSATLIARVVDASNAPIGNAPVSFRIINPTSGGETVSPVVVFTANIASSDLGAGEARTTFTSGSLSSGQSGVQIRASVVGTAVETEPLGVDLTPSGNDTTVVIGGTAGSIAFGQATKLAESAGGANYLLPMSVLVADSNGNPAPAGTVVTLSAWPIAWSTGKNCVYDDDDSVSKGTFKNEDVNENLILDPGEDGTRIYYYPPSLPASGTGKKDFQLTPPGAAAGLLPSTLTTDASGVAAFNLEYSKSNSIYTVVRIRASTILQQGSTPVSAQIIFRLAALENDVTPICRIPASPYEF
jgi:hypothetical protein